MPEEDMVDVSPDMGSQTQEFAIDAMENGFEELSLSGIFCVKQLQQLYDE